MPPPEIPVEPRDHRQHRRLAAAGMADQRHELALLHQKLELVDHRERSPGRRIDLADLEELDIAVEDRRACRLAHRLGRLFELGHRLDVGQAPLLALRVVLDAEIHQVLGDLGAQAHECRVVVQRRALAGPRDRHLEGAAEGRLRPGLQGHDAVGKQDRLVDVVGDQDDGLAFLGPDLLELVLQLGARQRVERREGLVEQQDVGIGGQRAGDGDALAHAAGKLGRPAVGGVAEADHVDVAPHARLPLGARHALEDRVDGERHVGADGEPRHQRIGLEDDAAVGAGALDPVAADGDLAGVGHGEAGHQRDEGRLARAGEAHDGHDLALLDGEVDVVQHLGPPAGVAVALAHAPEFEESHGCSPAPSGSCRR